MTIHKRLARLEGQQSQPDDELTIVLSLVGTTDADVIGMCTGSTPVMRQPGETVDDLVARARLLLSPDRAGLPVIMTSIYSDETRAKVKEQTA